MLSCLENCLWDEAGFSRICKDYMWTHHMWPGPPQLSIMAVTHMSFTNIDKAKRTDLGFAFSMRVKSMCLIAMMLNSGGPGHKWTHHMYSPCLSWATSNESRRQ